MCKSLVVGMAIMDDKMHSFILHARERNMQETHQPKMAQPWQPVTGL